jgi:hypothetical protein
MMTASQGTWNQKIGMEKVDVKLDRHRFFHGKELGGK